MSTNKDIKKKRNVWSVEEVLYFITLIKEKQVLGLMDGKRLRVSDIFKTLVAPMKEAGFSRDVSQLSVKWKNLKAEYYKCKRHNGVSGNDPANYEYYDALDEILGHRPSAQNEGFYCMEPETQEYTINEIFGICDADDSSILSVLEVYEDAPDVDGAIPGSSNTPGIQILATSASPGSPSAPEIEKVSTPASWMTTP